MFNLERVTMFQITTQPVHCFPEYAVGLALIDFKRTDLVDEVIEHVTEMHGVQQWRHGEAYAARPSARL